MLTAQGYEPPDPCVWRSQAAGTSKFLTPRIWATTNTWKDERKTLWPSRRQVCSAHRFTGNMVSKGYSQSPRAIRLITYSLMKATSIDQQVCAHPTRALQLGLQLQEHMRRAGLKGNRLANWQRMRHIPSNNRGIICHLPPFMGTKNNHWCKVETVPDLAAMRLLSRSHQTWTPNHWAPRWKHTKGKHFIGGFKLEKRYLSMCVYIYIAYAYLVHWVQLCII